MTRWLEEDNPELRKSMKDPFLMIPAQIEAHSSEGSPYAALYWQFTADFGYPYIKMCMEWAENCIERLDGLYEHTGD